jgi:hypothetical protein
MKDIEDRMADEFRRSPAYYRSMLDLLTPAQRRRLQKVEESEPKVVRTSIVFNNKRKK